MSASCIFCKIIKGDIPSFKLIETTLSYAFLDIGPLSKGHALVIPKVLSRAHGLLRQNTDEVSLGARYEATRAF